jgi:hypothetical protein
MKIRSRAKPISAKESKPSERQERLSRNFNAAFWWWFVGPAPLWVQEVECYRRLQQLKSLVMPNTVNILLTHYPHFFGYPELGIDLTLAGDIHGDGQLSLDFLHRGLNLSSLMGVP